MMEKRGRSPSLGRKNSIEQQSPDLYAVLEQKKLLTSVELKKVPIYSKHTVSSILYAQNVKRPHSFDKTKSLARRSVDKPSIALSKVIMPTKMKSNEDNLSSSYTKTSSPKPEDTKKPHPHFQSRKYVNVMENNVKSQKQEKQFGSKTVDAEKKLRFHDDLLSSKDDHNLTTYEECDKIMPGESNDISLIVEDRDNQHLVEDLHGEMESQKGDKILQCELLVPICLEGDADMPQSNTCSPDNVMVVESVNNEHFNDHNDETNQQDQASEVFDVGGDHPTRPNVDKENQLAENEQVVREVDIGSKVVEDDQERERREPEVKEGAGEVAPKKEDLISKMVVAYQHQVVAHGKKDLAAFNSVTEETISKLRAERSNKVKALVGAFESVISHEYDVLPKRSLHIINNNSLSL